MKTALIVTTYNRPDALGAVLEGYCRQSDQDFELVVADDDPPDLARLVGFQLLADPGIVEQPIRRACELLHDPRRSFWSNRAQVLV